MKSVLTIAGSDSSGGAGIQADIKTITCFGMYAMSAITSLTAQNTTGVYGVSDVTPEFVAKQLECVFEDIVPDSVKIGMVSNAGIIKAIAQSLKKYGARNIVLDPVMISTSGSPLLQQDAIDELTGSLLPLASIVTPNIPEAEALSGIAINGKADAENAAKLIYNKCHTAVLIKGGHSSCDADDLLFDGKEYKWFCSPKIQNNNTHGTGCTLSSAIACGLADGKSICSSVTAAKEYISGALRVNFDIGNGSGPLLHNYRFASEGTER
ncbi:MULTISPECIES: bifunctional hydroxymethylpyrimidine kinase/phosphomethylpyrimidine kinase [unclassified Ruminococcus]|uniref:bifunctional hydroxymethylpyrimidine kinase/phosphomethylpyrimidine kinase n=1 Tax=unclassified Ruminococcus TaxID=2608920 RepID=UPI00210BFB11